LSWVAHRNVEWLPAQISARPDILTANEAYCSRQSDFFWRQGWDRWALQKSPAETGQSWKGRIAQEGTSYIRPRHKGHLRDPSL